MGDAIEWEVRNGQTLQGPLSEAEVILAIEQGVVPVAAEVRPAGKTRWKPLGAHAPFAVALGRANAMPAATVTPASRFPPWLSAVAVGFGVALFAVLSATALRSSGPGPSEPAPTPMVIPRPTQESAPLQPPPPAMTDERETRLLIAAFWPRILDADAADGSWAGCRDGGKGFDEVRSCTDKARSAIAAIVERLPVTTPHTECGRETDVELRGYMNQRLLFLESYTTWLDANEKRIRPLLRSRSLGTLELKDEPHTSGFGLLDATDAPCIKKFLGCDGPCGAPKMDRAAGIRSR